MVLSINEHHPKIKQTHYCLNHSRDSFFRFQNSSLQCYCPHYKSWLYNTGLTFRLTPWLTLLNLKRVKMLWKGLAEPSNRTFNAHRCFQVYEIWQYLLCCVQIQTQFQQHSASVVSREQFKWNWILNYSVKEAQDTLAPVTPQLLDLESWFTLNCSRKENEKKGCRDTSLSLWQDSRFLPLESCGHLLGKNTEAQPAALLPPPRLNNHWKPTHSSEHLLSHKETLHFVCCHTSRGKIPSRQCAVCFVLIFAEILCLHSEGVQLLNELKTQKSFSTIRVKLIPWNQGCSSS